jgi:hypothetical protein
MWSDVDIFVDRLTRIQNDVTLMATVTLDDTHTERNGVKSLVPIGRSSTKQLVFIALPLTLSRRENQRS